MTFRLRALRKTPPLAVWLIGLGIVLALLGGFFLGYYARRLPVALPGAMGGLPAAAGDYALLDEVRGVIEEEFYQPASVDRQELIHGAARGMVQALGDPNSVYESPAEREANESRWSGRYEGVGMFVDQRDGLMVVTAPIEGGPAERAGVRPGDVLLEIDGRAVAGLSLTQQTLLIRGPKGSSVTLSVRREGAPSLQITIVRDEIRLISARGRMLDNGLGVLRLSQFTERTASEARAALDELLQAQPLGLLLDLRSNGGGLLEPAVEVAGFFLGGGPVVLESHPDGQEKVYDATAGPALTELPMLALVDRGSASATEVLAAALRDRGRAELVGERTYGKNTVQYIHRLSDGSGLRITVAEWRTPSGGPIPPTGLTPDWPVASPHPDPSASSGQGPLPTGEAVTLPPGVDPVLEAAARLLLERLREGARPAA